MKHIFSAYNYGSMRRVVNGATKILVHSLDFAHHSKIRQIVENRRNDVVELPNGVDTNSFTPRVSGEQIREKFSLDEDRVILFVGTLDRAHYFKGVEYLLRSFSELNEKDVQLLIVGEGNLKNRFTTLTGKLGASSKTKFVGEVFHEELPEYYAASDMVVLPSFETECFGLVLVEAMACGKPVIASDLPGVRTVVDHGKNGLLVEPKNVVDLTSKITYLLDNEPLRNTLGRTGRKKVEEKYSWSKIGLKLEETYFETVEG
jgi:glycosyltransferase involved in cell wall biosynthesis